MFNHTLSILKTAEDAAQKGASVNDILKVLRQLSLDEFGEFFLSLPNSGYPTLSRILPAMASEQTQRTWTGAAGVELLKQTASFARQVENNYIRYRGKPLQGSTIMDFGCGYGRILRMMYYYSDPENIWGVDAWDMSLETCREARLLGNFAKSDDFPTELPVAKAAFDLAFAFSIFTHLSPRAAEACLAAVRGHLKPGGLFIATVRPIEYWPFHDQTRGTQVAGAMAAEHRSQGFAYVPHNGPQGESYGDSSIDFAYFKRPGWEYLGHDWSLADVYQVSIILRAV